LVASRLTSAFIVSAIDRLPAGKEWGLIIVAGATYDVGVGWGGAGCWRADSLGLAVRWVVRVGAGAFLLALVPLSPCRRGWEGLSVHRRPRVARIEDPVLSARSIYRHPREGGDPWTFVQVAVTSYL
jgi:hypothetical protein